MAELHFPDMTDRELLSAFEAAIEASEEDERKIEALIGEMEQKFGPNEVMNRKLAKMREQTAELRQALEQLRARMAEEGDHG